jgi:hypothetical protein
MAFLFLRRDPMAFLFLFTGPDCFYFRMKGLDCVSFLCRGVFLQILDLFSHTTYQTTYASKLFSTHPGYQTHPNTFWSDARRRQAIVWLQNRTHYIEETVEGCRRALMTLFLVMLRWNPFLQNFCQLLDTLRSSDHIHCFIRLNLVDKDIGTPGRPTICDN